MATAEAQIFETLSQRDKHALGMVLSGVGLATLRDESAAAMAQMRGMMVKTLQTHGHIASDNTNTDRMRTHSTLSWLQRIKQRRVRRCGTHALSG